MSDRGSGDGSAPELPDSVRELLKLGLAGDDEQWFGEYRLLRVKAKT